ncbi:MAG: DUF5700 domain-containing putative Zn-dependent protease [Bacteroidota bacterium]
MPKTKVHQIALVLIFTLILFSCTPNSENSENTDSISKANIEFNIGSAQMVIEIARDIEAGKALDENIWDELFSSPGYKNYLVYRDSVWKKDLIKEAMFTVFDDSNSSKLDSLMELTVKLDKNFMKLSLVHNFHSIKTNLDEIERYLEETDFSKIFTRADSLALTYMPTRTRKSSADLYPVFIVVSDPDGRVQEKSIILDLNLMFEMGTEGLIKFIAHEFHHNYRGLLVSIYESPLMEELNKLHQEAIADLIDKKKPPIEKLGLFPKSIADTYNSDYMNTPNNLQTLDSLVVGYSTGKIDETIFNDRIKGFFKFGGHTTGIYMSFLINETIGKEQLIESCDNPVEFLRIYNSVAKGLKNEYIFSDSFIEYIGELEANAENKYAN